MNILAEKYDRYKAIRKDQRKFESRSFGRNSFKRNQRNDNIRSRISKDHKKFQLKVKRKRNQWREIPEKLKDRDFDKK